MAEQYTQEKTQKKRWEDRVVSGMRPTGRLHLGHYFGVLTNYLSLQEKHPCFFMVADLHALSTGTPAQNQLRSNTYEMILDWFSVGVDPKKAVVFVQSAISEHSELFVLLSQLTPLGWLERNPTYKEQKEQLGEKATANLGFLAYPVLQAVDVCLYKGTLVPVGEDQKPHLEMGRELVRRMNFIFEEEVFPEFQALLTYSPKLLGIDNRKMSKSYGNQIDLADAPEVVCKKVQKMITDINRPRREDPGHPEVCNLFSYHKLFSSKEKVEEIEKNCRSAILSCGEDKKIIADQIIAWQEPFLRRRKELEKDPEYVFSLVREGCEKAKEVAEKTMHEVRKKFNFYYSIHKTSIK